ncbi:hypothetical protein [Parabacteroides sp. PF5-9]|uniref:hypothetical protein n=1 Tax=Parabacteroides sp. PF5-9 TaxID=1742404 RepID=UPI002473BD57|nr:hypothetical protein [Parabacteroides sp. PF5-9]MDH6358283.1 hypothetical protein [Parabacteroides sp. PF5-9]
MYNNKLLILLLFILIGGVSVAQGLLRDSISDQKRKPQFLAVNTMGGLILKTNEYIKEGSRIPAYNSFSLKYGIRSTGDEWEDVAYGMPYYGVGFYVAKFYNKKGLGVPLSFYLFQGGDLGQIGSLPLKYELNLGMSFNWTPYDAFDNPKNVAVGGQTNVHVGANVYLKKKLNEVWDLNFGLGLTHFSNGAKRLPNKGVNLFAPFVELVYNFNDKPVGITSKEKLTPPVFEKRMDYDIVFTTTSRHIKIDTLETGLPSRYLDRDFKVFGLSYATLFVPNYKYKWGPSVELVYDESSEVKVWREQHPDDGMFYDRVKLGSWHNRFSLGLSIKGEMSLPYVSFFAQLGYNILHTNDYDYRFYQIIGAKAYLKDNLFGTFGIRANRFSKAQYLYWSIGYTIKGKRLKKKEIYLYQPFP